MISRAAWPRALCCGADMQRRADVGDIVNCLINSKDEGYTSAKEEGYKSRFIGAHSTKQQQQQQREVVVGANVDGSPAGTIIMMIPQQ